MSCLKIVLIVALLTSSGFAAEPGQLTADQVNLLEAARAVAMQYTNMLPDFICTQITHRLTARSIAGTSSLGAGVTGRSPIGSISNGLGFSNDVIEEQLTYVGGTESYQVLTVNGKKVTGMDHMQFQGAISEGEFGSMLVEVFDPRSHTTFKWSHVAHQHGRFAWVYDFHVPSESGTSVVTQDSDKVLVVSLSGQVFIDPETKNVLEISSKLDLPINFPIRLAQRSIEFAMQQIAGKSYNLPAHSLVHLEDSSQTYDNRIDFKDYHRFASESTIHFDGATPETPPK